MRWALDVAYDYLETRSAFGKPIVRRQHAAFRMAGRPTWKLNDQRLQFSGGMGYSCESAVRRLALTG